MSDDENWIGTSSALQLVILIGLAAERIQRNIRGCECSKDGCSYTSAQKIAPRDEENPED